MISIQKEGFPSVDLNKVTVNTIYRGASAEDVELNVTTKLEEEIREVNGLYEVTSTSRENVSAIVIQADEDANSRELSIIVNDIKFDLGLLDEDERLSLARDLEEAADDIVTYKK